MKMSGGKKRSGFQITSVTSDSSQPTSPAGRMSPSVVQTIQSDIFSIRHIQGSSSQPTTPSPTRKNISHDASGQGAGCSSRFRVVRLTGGGAGQGGRSKSYQRGRWTCMEFMERLKEAGFRRVMDSMRHAHSLESLEMIGRDRERGGVHSQDTTHMLTQPVSDTDGMGLVLRSRLTSPTNQEPISIRLLDRREPISVQGLDSTPSPVSPRPQNFPRPLQLEMDATVRVHTQTYTRSICNHYIIKHKKINHANISLIKFSCIYYSDLVHSDSLNLYVLPPSGEGGSFFNASPLFPYYYDKKSCCFFLLWAHFFF